MGICHTKTDALLVGTIHDLNVHYSSLTLKKENLLRSRPEACILELYTTNEELFRIVK